MIDRDIQNRRKIYVGIVILLCVIIAVSIVLVTDISIGESGDQIRGTVQIDETGIEGAKVEVWNGEDMVSSTTTDSNGEYVLDKPKNFNGEIVVSVEGFESSKTNHPLYAGDSKRYNNTANFEFNSDNSVITNVNKTNISVIFGKDTNINKVANVEMLQSMNHDLHSDYRLIRDINANETHTYNELNKVDRDLLITNPVDGSSYIQDHELRYEPVVDTLVLESLTQNDIDYNYIQDSNTVRIDNSDRNSLSAVFNIKYETENDIYRGFEPIGSSNNKFNGTFNGKNHTISNLYINREDDYSGVFGNISEEGSVKNVEYTNIDA